MPKPVLILAAILLVPPWSPPLGAWGRQGHELVAATALRDLPPRVAAWFSGREAEVRGHANDPDDWKLLDPLEHPRHYLHCEPYGGPARVPRARAEAEARLGPGFQANGQLPWTLLDRVGRLAAAFAAGDSGRAAVEASWLSHYVGDLNVPMHATVNHNGERTGQGGVHHRWEMGLLDRLVAGGWRPPVRPAELAKAAPWAWLEESFRLIPGVLAGDLAARQEPAGPVRDPDPGPGYWSAYLRLQGGQVQEQLTLAAQRSARMILLAWIRAGAPPAPELKAAAPVPAGPRSGSGPRP